MGDFLKWLLRKKRKDRSITPDVHELADTAYEKRQAFLRRKAPCSGVDLAERLALAFDQEQARAELIEAEQDLRKAQGLVTPRTPPPWPAPPPVPMHR